MALDWVDKIDNQDIVRAEDVNSIAHAIMDNENSIEVLLSTKADKADTLEGYGITDSYTKQQTDAALSGKSNATNLVNGSGIGSLKSVSAASADGIDSFAAGDNTEATGERSSAFGFSSKAEGRNSSALGNATKAIGDDQTVIGRYNATDANKAFIIGNGNYPFPLHATNAHTVDWNGNGWFAGKVTVGENGEELITVSDALENLCPHTTVSAENSESLTITDGLSGTKLKECTVYGTEEGVGDYNSTTQKYDIPITVRGKNLLHYVGGATPPAYNILTCDGSECVLNGTANSNISVNYSENYNIHLSAGAYRFSFIPVSGRLVNRNNAYDEFYVGLRKRNTAWLTSTGGLKHTTYSVKQTLSFTLQEDVDCSFGLVGKGVADNYTFRVQLEKGSSATEYEPYTAPQRAVLSLDAPLYEGESASLSEGGERLTVLPVKTNIIEVGTSETPSKLEISYYRDINSGEVFAPLDKYGQIPDEYIKGKTVKEYGVRWNGTSQTACVRLGDAEGLTANAHKGSTDSVENDFDSIYPWSDIRLCNVDSEGNILAYIGEPTFKRDGTNGDVMVEIPKFYYKRTKTGTKEEWWICGVKLPGYELHPLFINDGQEVSKVFHSAYNVSSYTDETDNKVKLQSISGVQPQVRTTRANFRTYARNKGENWGIEDLSCIHALQMLYMVEYANTNSQSVLGSGADSLSYTANHKALVETTEGNTITISSAYENVYKIGQRIEIGTSQGIANRTSTPRTITAISTDDETERTTITFDGDAINISVNDMMWNAAPLNGSCDDLNGKSGWLAGENNYTEHYADVNYRGIEGFHGKLYRFSDGVNIKNRVVYYANSMEDYADGVYNGAYRAIGYTNGSENGYISAFGYDEKAPWVMLPVSVSASPATSSSTYIPDYYYQNTGERIALTGGHFRGGTFGGVFNFDCQYQFSSADSGFGAHIIMKKA